MNIAHGCILIMNIALNFRNGPQARLCKLATCALMMESQNTNTRQKGERNYD